MTVPQAFERQNLDVQLSIHQLRTALPKLHTLGRLKTVC